MNKTRLPVVIMTVALFSAAGLALLTYYRTTEAMGSSPSSSGMGDLQLIEAQQNSASGGALKKSNPYVGMGDLHSFEGPASSSSYSGIGDLHLFEAQQYNASGGALKESNPYIGMGDLRRFEAEQLLATTNVSSVQLPDGVCPNPSTSYRERDAGASTPA